jgi:hypothetical protein
MIFLLINYFFKIFLSGELGQNTAMDTFSQFIKGTAVNAN